MSSPALAHPGLSIEALLGGRRVLPATPRTPLDWVSVIRQGIPATAVDALTSVLRVSQSELATAVASRAHLARRKKEGTLNSEETAKLVRLARVVAEPRRSWRTWTPRSTG